MTFWTYWVDLGKKAGWDDFVTPLQDEKVTKIDPTSYVWYSSPSENFAWKYVLGGLVYQVVKVICGYLDKMG